MNEKLCIKCHTYPQRSKNQSYCDNCNRAYGRANYLLNRERYIAQAKKRDRQLDELINSYKSKPCTDCKVTYPPFVMDFDHLDGDTKSFGICTMRRKRMSFALIVAEIAKCEVVCANCHRIRTNSRNPARYSK